MLYVVFRVFKRVVSFLIFGRFFFESMESLRMVFFRGFFLRFMMKRILFFSEVFLVKVFRVI